MKHIKRCLLIANLFLLFICLFKVDEKVFSQEYILSTNDEINIVYSQGDLPTGDPNIILFDEYKTNGIINVSNSLILAGPAFKNVIPESKINEKIESSNGVITRLDSETYTINTNGEKISYSFTGWHIKGATEYLPSKTVFQPGDLILEEVLSEYIDKETKTISLEAMWGKCYFIKKPYENMIYTYVDKVGYILDEAASLSASNNIVNSSDTNTGLSITDPKASIDGLFEVFRKNVFTDKTQDRGNAYKTVMMLCGDVEYAKDTSGLHNGSSLSNYFGQKVSNKNTASLAVTIKSYQETDGNVYTIYYKPKGYSNTIFGNTRFDNVNLYILPSNKLGTQTSGTEFPLEKYVNPDYSCSYFEMTARFNENADKNTSAIITFRPGVFDLVVYNGGYINTMQTSWSSKIDLHNNVIEWYIGRKARLVSALNCGTTASYEDSVQVVDVNFKVTVTGGSIKTIYGGSNGRNVTTIGNREFRIIGNGEETAGEYNPSITDIFGGSSESKLYGDISVSILNAKCIKNVYGGGDKYTAITYGNIDINIVNSKLSGDLFGGGKNANSEYDSTRGKGGDVKINIDNSIIEGNIFGSGMGMTQTMTITENIYSWNEKHEWYNKSKYPNGYYKDDWDIPLGYDTSGNPSEDAIGYYPKYDDKTGYFIIGSYKTITWTAFSAKVLNFKYNYVYAYLSLATVENVKININDSTIGTSTNKKGNVYGGGSIAQVLGDIEIDITGAKTKIYGSIYGGGDGVSVPDKVDVYTLVSPSKYTGPRYTVASYDKAGLPSKVTITNQVPDIKKYDKEKYTWINDPSLLNRDTKGIDYDKKLLYSPNTVGLGKVFGDIKLKISDGTVFGTIYGGGNKGEVVGKLDVKISGKANVKDVFGGCNQADIVGDIFVNIDTDQNYPIPNLYGGNNIDGKIDGSVNVLVNNGSITNLYGGGNKADSFANTNVTVLDGNIHTLYGGGKEASVGDVTVSLNGGNITNAYGGGDQGITEGNINVDSTANITTFFGGANKADVNGDVTLNFSGGTVTTLYSGNNEKGNIKGSIKGTYQNTNVTTFYGGGNKANDDFNTSITINSGEFNMLYGGGKEASVGSVSLNLLGGTIENAFGGGDVGLTINDVNINSKANITTLYGGANQANIGGSVTIEINGGIIETLYSGNNVSGNITGSISTTISNSLITTLYGGGNEANDDYLSTIEISHSTVNDLYGGGKKASVGSVDLNISDSTITNAFGGGDEGILLGDITFSTNATITTLYGGANKANIDGNITLNITGGSINTLYCGNNESGDIKYNINATINNANITTLYGGGNNANDNITTNLTINNSHFNEIYGGGRAADVDNVIISIKDSVVDSNIYGGGYEGHVSGNVSLSIESGTFNKNIYGGGYAGTVGSTNVSIIDNGIILINGNVFGGGEGQKATVKTTTDVIIDLDLNLSATETKFTSDTISGKSEVNVTILDTTYSKIFGNVYGGGDLGQVGSGNINTGNNTADVTNVGSTNVLIKNGYILGSIFGGGSGIPKGEERYDVTMGTIFGFTRCTIEGGYIGNNVYGGGTQSRLYAPYGFLENVAEVKIIESTKTIVINGSVFGGGDRGNSATTNASVPTTIGNVLVSIKGNGISSSKIFFVNGGVYGDGNLCLVRGHRTIEITNFTTATDALKTFYSLQRADEVNLTNSDIVLLGAVDLVEEGDTTVYSINRISQINMYQGSTIKLDQIVKYLGSVKSDVLTNRNFLNDSEKLVETNELDEVEDYILCQNGFLNVEKNTISVANGLYLEIVQESNNKYGTVIGLFTLQLLIPNVGEGGGFVYASEEFSTGDFICETLMKANTILNKNNAMPVVDDYGGTHNIYGSQHYWYIQGDTINYILSITGYIGSEEESYLESAIIPNHNDNLVYVLNYVTPNQQLINAISSNKYTLVSKNTGLTEQEIAIEIVIATNHLFLTYVDGVWGLSYNSNIINGFNNDTKEVENNALFTTSIDSSINKASIILHKSKGVNAEVTNMQVQVGLNLFINNEGTYNDYTGTSKLVYKIGFSIVRLVPVQNMYQGPGKNYSGLSSSDNINITLGSSFTVEYQTRYIPSAFPKGGNVMNWSLIFETYSYYIDGLGNFMTLDSEDDVINISSTLTRDENDKSKIYVQKEDDKYYYLQDSKRIEFQQMTIAQTSSLPKGVKITMIDMSNEISPNYYYYICEDTLTTSLNLDQFMYMGTKTKINNTDVPTYKQLYLDGQAARVTERLIFIFDFSEAVMSGEVFSGNIVLEHIYGSTDIMDYVKTDINLDNTIYTRAYPKACEYNICLEKNETGVENFDLSFDNENYNEDDIAHLSVTITKDTNWTNTLLNEGKLGLKIEAPNGLKLPDGIEFVYNSITYYPMNKNSYVIIPVSNFGEHDIQILNILGTIKTTNIADFVTTLIYLPSSQHFNDDFVKTDKVVDSDTKCEILPTIDGAMKVTMNNTIIKLGEDIELFIELKNTKTNIVTLEIYPKVDTHMPDAIAIIDIRGNQNFVYNTDFLQIQSGAYLFVFRCGTHEEHVNVIIID